MTKLLNTTVCAMFYGFVKNHPDKTAILANVKNAIKYLSWTDFNVQKFARFWNARNTHGFDVQETAEEISISTWYKKDGGSVRAIYKFRDNGADLFLSYEYDQERYGYLRKHYSKFHVIIADGKLIKNEVADTIAELDRVTRIAEARTLLPLVAEYLTRSTSKSFVEAAKRNYQRKYCAYTTAATVGALSVASENVPIMKQILGSGMFFFFTLEDAAHLAQTCKLAASMAKDSVSPTP